MLLRQEPIVLDNLVSSPARGRLSAVGSVVQPGPAVAGSPRRATATALRWALLALPLGVGTALRVVSLYQSPAPSYRESALVTQVAELSCPGCSAASNWAGWGCSWSRWRPRSWP